MKKRYISKLLLAKAIDEGLKLVSEDPDVFVAKGARGSICGCALAIATAGLSVLGDEHDMAQKNTANANGFPAGSKLVEIFSKDDGNEIGIFARLLGISHPLAYKLDALHREDRVPARQIAERLRRNQI